MGRYDRYMLGQLIRVFGFFGLVLVAVYWVNRAARLFDTLISDGQSFGVFLEFSALGLPSLVQLVLPIAGVAAGLYVTYRLSGDSELVALQAAGVSPLRMARPVLAFGILAAVLVLFLTHYLVPLSKARLIARQAEVAENATARLLTPGRFLSVGAGLTLFVGDTTPQGGLQGVFLSDARSDDSETTYTAREAYVVRSENGPQLVMIDGQAQHLSHADKRLTVTGFDDLAYDIGALLPDTDAPRGLRDITTLEILRDPGGVAAETTASPAQMSQELNARTAKAGLTLIAGLIGFAPLLLGGFSRFGLGPQMVGAVALVVLVMAADTIGNSAASESPEMWGMAYLGTLVGGAAALCLLVWASEPWRRRARA